MRMTETIGRAATKIKLVAGRLAIGFTGDDSLGPRTSLAIDGYDAHKAAQVSAYFVGRAGGALEKKKLSKLLYLVERESAQTRGYPMIFDECFSIAEGPICTNALKGLNQLSETKIWRRFVQRDKATEVISSVPGTAMEALDHLSEADIAIADALWTRHGAKSADELVAWTHEHLPEYTPTTKERIPITDEAMARGIGLKSPADYAAGVAEVRDMRASDPFR